MNHLHEYTESEQIVDDDRPVIDVEAEVTSVTPAEKTAQSKASEPAPASKKTAPGKADRRGVLPCAAGASFLLGLAPSPNTANYCFMVLSFAGLAAVSWTAGYEVTAGGNSPATARFLLKRSAGIPLCARWRL
jgi:hypothetical protein